MSFTRSFQKEHKKNEYSRKITEYNFSSLRIILLFPVITGLLTYCIAYNGDASPLSGSIPCPVMIPSLLLDVSLVVCFFLALRNPPKHASRFNKIVLILWILAVLSVSVIGFGLLFFLVLIVSLILLSFFILMKPLVGISFHVLLFFTIVFFYRYTVKTEPVFYQDISSSEKFMHVVLIFFFLASLTLLTTFRYHSVVRSFAEATTIQRHQRELEEASILRDHIDRIIRHDMRTPISGMVGLARLLKTEKVTEEESLRYLDMIEESGSRLISLLENYLDIDRMENNTYVPRKTEFDTIKLIDEVSASLMELLAVKNLHIRCINASRTVSGLCPVLSAERNKIFHMLSNLLQNAAEASPPGHVITVTVGQHEACTTIAIHNHGVIASSIHENLFAKYVSAGKNHGTGLGTYSARMIARAHGGDITFTSSEEEGTTFTITLSS